MDVSANAVSTVRGSNVQSEGIDRSAPSVTFSRVAYARLWPRSSWLRQAFWDSSFGASPGGPLRSSANGDSPLTIRRSWFLDFWDREMRCRPRLCFSETQKATLRPLQEKCSPRTFPREPKRTPRVFKVDLPAPDVPRESACTTTPDVLRCSAVVLVRVLEFGEFGATGVPEVLCALCLYYKSDFGATGAPVGRTFSVSHFVNPQSHRVPRDWSLECV